MDEKEIMKVAGLLNKYYRIANIPNELNNIIIKGNIISIKENGVEIFKRELFVDKLKEDLEQMNYMKNVFSNSEDSIYNPFEADREENKYIWKYDYNHIDFPKFISVLLFSLLAVGKIPSIIEFCKIYILAYTEAFDPKYSNPMRMSLYALPNVKDRCRVGQTILFDGQKLSNNLLRFTEKYKVFLKDLPINEFTTEHICSRIYKVYGSIVRDIYNVLYFDKLGAKSYYNFLDDLAGIDLMINDVPVFAYTNTKGGQEFRQKKIEERHPELNNIGIALEKKVYSEKIGGVFLINEETAKKVIEVANELNEQGLKKIIKVSF